MVVVVGWVGGGIVGGGMIFGDGEKSIGRSRNQKKVKVTP